MFIFERNAVRDDTVHSADLDVDHACDLPCLEHDAETLSK